MYALLKDCEWRGSHVQAGQNLYPVPGLIPNTLPNFKCKNIAINNSVSEKFLGTIINNKLDFKEHCKVVCEKRNLKLHALSRTSSYLSPGQHVVIINAYINSLSNYWGGRGIKGLYSAALWQKKWKICGVRHPQL